MRLFQHANYDVVLIKRFIKRGIRRLVQYLMSRFSRTIITYFIFPYPIPPVLPSP